MGIKSTKGKFIVTISSVILLFSAMAAFGVTDSISSKWAKTREFSDKEYLGKMTFSVAYFSAEYIQASIAEEAEKNLWTASELENYKYQYLKTLQLDEYIPFYVSIDNNGPAMHMAPFGDQVILWVGKKQYKPVDYDKRFNFALTGKIEGFVYFPRYDEKTGKSILEGIDTIRLVVNSGVSAMSIKGGNFDYLWNIAKDDPKALMEGTAADRLEADRLIKRLQKLNADKTELETKLQENIDEIAMIEARLAEIQSK